MGHKKEALKALTSRRDYLNDRIKLRLENQQPAEYELQERQAMDLAIKVLSDPETKLPTSVVEGLETLHVRMYGLVNTKASGLPKRYRDLLNGWIGDLKRLIIEAKERG